MKKEKEKKIKKKVILVELLAFDNYYIIRKDRICHSIYFFLFLISSMTSQSVTFRERLKSNAIRVYIVKVKLRVWQLILSPTC